jgi:hypothetical protein
VRCLPLVCVCACAASNIPEESRSWADEVHATVVGHRGDLQRCHEQGMARDPDLYGRVVAKIQLDRTGKVVGVEVVPEAADEVGGIVPPMGDPEVVRCAEQAFAAMQFPAPEPPPKKFVVIRYPFVFPQGGWQEHD